MFNPVFPAVMMAIMKSNMNLMMGIPHVPKKHKPITDGALFKRNYAGADIDEYPRSDLVEEMEEERDA